MSEVNADGVLLDPHEAILQEAQNLTNSLLAEKPQGLEEDMGSGGSPPYAGGRYAQAGPQKEGPAGPGQKKQTDFRPTGGAYETDN